MGRRHGPGPWTPERRQKMRETLNSMSSEALRYCRIEHKSRWLTRLIVVHADKKVFAFDGIDPLTRRRFKMHLEFPLDVTLSEFLTAVMNCADAPMTMRLDCAKNAATLMHERPRPVVTVEREQQIDVARAQAPVHAEALPRATISRRRRGCGKPGGRRGMTPRALDGASAQHTGNRHDGQHHTIVVVAIARKRGWRMPRPRAPSGSNQTLGTGQARSQKRRRVTVPL